MKNLQYLIKFKPHQRELFQSAATHTIPSIIFRMLKEASKWQKQKQKMIVLGVNKMELKAD